MSKEIIKSLRSESPIGRIFDLPELLSPMLVKELRQGLRSVSFTGLFIAMQGLLGVIIFLMLIEGANASPTPISIAIFTIYIIAVCGIQPLRGINAISSEVSGDTIDLVLITKLTSWKIVFGKWVSLMAQSLIFSISLLPYIILRYFMGEMLLLHELYLFLVVFLIGSVSTAISVGCSSITTAVLRFILTAVLLLVILIFTLVYINFAITAADFFDSVIGTTVSSFIYLYFAIGFIIVGAYLCWMFLDFGASIIAPLSENRSTLRRLLYLLLLLIGTIACTIIRFTVIDFEEILISLQMILFFLFVPFFITTFTEHAYLSPRIVMSMSKKPIISKFKYLLYPGWATGAIFLTLCIVLHFAMILLLIKDSATTHSYGFDNEDIMMLYSVISCLIGTLVFPAAAISLFGNKVTNRLGIYLIILIGSLLITLITYIFSAAVESGIAMIFVWLPSVNFYTLVEGGRNSADWIGPLNTVFIIAYMAIVVIKSKSVWSHIFHQEKAVKGESSDTPPPLNMN